MRPSTLSSSSTEPVVPTRTKETDDDLLQRGQKMADAALLTYPDSIDVVEALAKRCSDPEWTLCPATTRTYKGAIVRFIEGEVDDGRCDPATAVEAIEDITASLFKRRGHPPARTSRKKLLSATPEQLKTITTDLIRLHLIDPNDLVNTALLRMTEVDPYLGLRPCECARARIVGRTLVVPNAKNTNGRAAGECRIISLERMPAGLVLRLADLIRLLTLLLPEHGCWKKLHKVLAERIARICARLGLPRISLYTLRHTAIATWKRARLNRVTIAALAGHISTKTASRHYAGSRRGWSPELACVGPDQSSVEIVKQALGRKKRSCLAPPWSPPERWSYNLRAP